MTDSIEEPSQSHQRNLEILAIHQRNLEILARQKSLEIAIQRLEIWKLNLIPKKNRFNKLIHTTFNFILEWELEKISYPTKEPMVALKILPDENKDHIASQDTDNNHIHGAKIKKHEDFSEQIHGAQEFSEVAINSLLYLIEYLKYFLSLSVEDRSQFYRFTEEQLEEQLKAKLNEITNEITQKKGKKGNFNEQQSEQLTQDEQELNQHEQELKQLIKMVFILSLKKEESRYPRFQLYVPLVKSNSFNSDLIKFDQDKTPTTIDLDNLDSIARLSLGIPEKYALLVKKCEHGCLFFVEGIIKIEKPNLAGILLHVDAPGRLSITYTYSLKKEIKEELVQEELVQVKLALVESKIRKYSDPVENPMVNIFAFKLAKNICNNVCKNLETEDFKQKNQIEKLIKEGKFYKNLFPPIISIVKKFFNDILKLAVDFGHGGQFVILTKEFEEEKQEQERYKPHLNIRYCVVEEQDIFQKKIQEFLKKTVYFLLESEDENREATLRYEKLLSSYEKLFSRYKELRSSYEELLKCVERYTESIAYLSTVDGSIILNSNLSLIGFGGQTISNSTQTNDKYFPIEIESTFNGENESPTLEDWDELKKITKFYSKHFKQGKKEWEFKKFGTRHQSAARLCNHATELDPFIFVVSQTGDIREFMKIKDEEGQEYVGVLGPLRPL